MGRSLARIDKRQRMAQINRLASLIEREDDITYNAAVTELYGGSSEPLFSPYTERPLMAFSMIGAYHPLLDWIGWRPSLEWFTQKGFISYVAADGAAADTPSSGVVTDPCSAGNTIEFGKCDYIKQGFGRLRRQTPSRSDDNDGLVYNKLIAQHRIDGTLIRNEKEYDMLLCTSVIIQDLHRQLIVGNRGASTAQFDGLQQLVVYGYQDSEGNSCSAMDSYVVDWNSLPMSGAISDSSGTAITINGVAVPNGTYNLYGMFEWILRNIKIRLGVAPTLSNRINRGDAVLAMPQSWIKPFLNVVTCFTKCGGDYARMTTDAALTFYNNLWLENDPLADAAFEVEGTTVLITGYDYELDNGDGTADFYLLIKGSNGNDFLYGEYKDNRPTVQAKPNKYATTDNGMLLTWAYEDQTCERRVVQGRFRLHMPAPFAQVRIQNVPYEGILSPLSSDPLNANYISNLIKAGFV